MSFLEGLEAGGERFSLLSEELGRRSFGADHPLILLDPIDGSLNAKQGIPVFSCMLALVEGSSLGEVTAGHVENLVSREVWSTARGEGVTRGGRPVEVLPVAGPSGRFEVLGLESSPEAIYEAEALVRASGKIRVLGSMALSIAHTAAGHMDAFCAPIRARVFDMSASLLMVRELGGVATDLEGRELWGLAADLETRASVLISSSPEAHAHGLGLLGRA